jgi:hypothetical protein
LTPLGCAAGREGTSEVTPGPGLPGEDTDGCGEDTTAVVRTPTAVVRTPTAVVRTPTAT